MANLYEVSKRGFDFVAAGIGVVILLPLFVVLALVVRRSSPGPIFYRAQRVGKGGRTFNVLKFRTMVVGAEQFGHTTALGDVRLTPAGAFLRKYKLDELPQLFNVLRGEMSLVGPRPEVAIHTNDYDAAERRILDVRPGITDYASIRFVNHEDVIGKGSPAEAHEAFVSKIRTEKNQLRLQYVDQRSFFEDLRILALTTVAILRKFLPAAVHRDADSTDAPGGAPGREQQRRTASHVPK